MKNSTLPSFAPLVLTCLLLLTPMSHGEESCREGNLLAGLQPVEWLDVYHVARITDGKVSPDGGPWDSSTNAPATPYGYVVYDLGGDTRIRSVYLQVEGSSGYRIAVSSDRESWTAVSNLPPAGSAGMRERRASGLDTPARYLRIAAAGPQALYAIGEAAVWCRPPDEWPPRFETRAGVVRDAAWSAQRKQRLGFGKLIYLALGGGLFVVARRYPRRATGCYVAVTLLGALAWTHFGTFHGNGVLHYHENYHYYMGAEYFEENRYTGLYDCTVWAERELGLEAVARNRYVTDLATNRMVTGGEILASEPECRAAFSDTRWTAFREDVRYFRNNLYPGSWQRVFRDHGYNPTPAWTLLGKTAASAGSDAATTIPRVVWIDVVLWLGIGALVLWAFGLEALAVTFLTLGGGLPWFFDFTGGGFARFGWLLCLVAGVCLLRKQRPFAGGFALALAAALRVFPAVFFGVLGLAAIASVVRKRPLGEYVRVFSGAALAAVLVLALTSAGVGASSWGEFAENTRKHAKTPMGNLMGLPAVVTFDADAAQSRMLDTDIESLQRWRAARGEAVENRRGITWTVAALFVGLCAWTVWRRDYASWEWVILGLLLVVSLGQISSYYYVFMILLAPWVAKRLAALAVLIVFLAASQVIGIAGFDTDVRFLWLSVVFVLLPLAQWLMRVRHAGAEA